MKNIVLIILGMLLIVQCNVSKKKTGEIKFKDQLPSCDSFFDIREFTPCDILKTFRDSGKVDGVVYSLGCLNDLVSLISRESGIEDSRVGGFAGYQYISSDSSDAMTTFFKDVEKWEEYYHCE